eukprot:jgi/Tetstr1/444354/TSEL_032245.t1
MDPSLREALNDAGIFKNGYTTTYLCSPIVHWLQDHGAEGLHDCDKPHTAYVTATQYGNRGGYIYISTFHHAYSVTRMLQAVVAIQDKECIVGYSLDYAIRSLSCDDDFARAGSPETLPRQ